jgi:drug/metabolite transporter (DMT)-like permease
MSLLLPILFAAIAAIGNAVFAFGQKQSSGAENGLLFVAASAVVAVVLSLACAPLLGRVDPGALLRAHGWAVLVSGIGLFLTYLGFNLLYTRFGASHYVLYAALSIVTTTVIVGIVVLHEPVTPYHWAAVVLAIAAVIAFSIGQARI